MLRVEASVSRDERVLEMTWKKRWEEEESTTRAEAEGVARVNAEAELEAGDERVEVDARLLALQGHRGARGGW